MSQLTVVAITGAAQVLLYVAIAIYVWTGMNPERRKGKAN